MKVSSRQWVNYTMQGSKSPRNKGEQCSRERLQFLRERSCEHGQCSRERANLRLYKEQQSSLLHQCPRWHTQACLAPMCLKNGSGNALAGRLWEFFLGRILKTLPHPKCTAHLVCSRDSSCEWVDFVSAVMLAYLSRNVRPSRYQNGTHQTPSRIHSTTDVPVLLARKGVWHIHS